MYRARSKGPGSALLRGNWSHGTRWRINVCLLFTGILLLLVSVVRLQVGLTAMGDGVGLASGHRGVGIHELKAMNSSTSKMAVGLKRANGAVSGGRLLRIDRQERGTDHGDLHRGDDSVVDTEREESINLDGMGRGVSRDVVQNRRDYKIRGGGVSNFLSNNDSDDDNSNGKKKLSTALDEVGDEVNLMDVEQNGVTFQRLGKVGLDDGSKSENQVRGFRDGRSEDWKEEEEEEEEEDCLAEEAADLNSKLRCNGRQRAERLGASRLWSGSDVLAFSSDDEPVDEETRSRVERFRNIEDALLLTRGSVSSLAKNETWGKIEDSKMQQKNGVIDPLNPENNPLLQDPDSADSGGLTKDDKLLLKVLRFQGKEPPPAPVVHRDAERVVQNPLEELDIEVRSRAMEGRRKQSLQSDDDGSKKVQGDEGDDGSKRVQGDEGDAGSNRVQGDEGDDGSKRIRGDEGDDGSKRVQGDEVSGDGSKDEAGQSVEMPQNTEAMEGGVHRTERIVHKLDPRKNVRWGEFPGLHPHLSFSGFIEEFAFGETCSLRVFMAWMSPGWAFTVRHQRVLESLLYFHPNACVVVFSETVELSFFSSFVDDGYHVAVMQPNLEVLLKDTASNVFGTIWAEWRQVELFYIHYTELLRLAALHKYGGVYLDWDMIVLKPLDKFRNMLGIELLKNGHQRPNGAIMAFDSGSPFLNITMDEFTATYDEKQKEWNGAELLTRVLNAPPDDKYIHLANKDRPHLEPPISFFPLTSSRIVSYFKAPEDDYALTEDLKLLDKILARSYTVHLWNDLTRRLVPEPGSLVARLMDKNCLRCNDVL